MLGSIPHATPFLGLTILIGYNGFPRGCSDDVLPWARAKGLNELDVCNLRSARANTSPTEKLIPCTQTKYPYVVHAELNCILNKNASSAEGCRLYVSLFPCNECAKVLIQAGVVEVVFLSQKHHQLPTYEVGLLQHLL